jgi:hypothetical protein
MALTSHWQVVIGGTVAEEIYAPPKSLAQRKPKEMPMNSPVALALAVLALIWSAGLALAQQYGTATEAKFMLERAVALLTVS